MTKLISRRQALSLFVAGSMLASLAVPAQADAAAEDYITKIGKVAVDRDGVSRHRPIGTPAYMAPEQLAGRRAEARSDQFACCVTLYEALYGERPFAGDTLPTPPLTLSQADLLVARSAVQAVQMQGRLEHYLVQLVCATRPGSGLCPELEPLVAVGASPRASIGLARAARARAWLAGIFRPPWPMATTSSIS